MDKERIYAKMDEMDQYLKELQEVIPDSLESYKASIEKKRATERLLQITIEAVMDICAMLVKELRLGLPSVEEDFLEKLKENVLEPSLVKKLKEMRGFKNILVHGYSKIDDERVFEILSEKLKDFQGFRMEVLEFLGKN